MVSLSQFHFWVLCQACSRVQISTAIQHVHRLTTRKWVFVCVCWWQQSVRYGCVLAVKFSCSVHKAVEFCCGGIKPEIDARQIDDDRDKANWIIIGMVCFHLYCLVCTHTNVFFVIQHYCTSATIYLKKKSFTK
jgi:hypothetical protein